MECNRCGFIHQLRLSFAHAGFSRGILGFFLQVVTCEWQSHHLFFYFFFNFPSCLLQPLEIHTDMLQGLYCVGEPRPDGADAWNAPAHFFRCGGEIPLFWVHIGCLTFSVVRACDKGVGKTMPLCASLTGYNAGAVFHLLNTTMFLMMSTFSFFVCVWSHNCSGITRKYAVFKDTTCGDLGPSLLTTISPIICILEPQWNQEMHVLLIFFFPPLTQVLRYSSPGCRRSGAAKSGLCSSGFAPTVYLLVTFAARPQPHHNYPTYSLNRNHAWQEPPATKVGLLKAAFLFREFNSHSIINGLYLFGHQRGCISAWTNRRRGTKLDRLNSLNKEYRGL